jgi:2-C-methyl-D-erythritol 4-phosphate cytidylyltransferase/2-C-methyl-D-erythritol 2,4-cyclodiphosphate synthase
LGLGRVKEVAVAAPGDLMEAFRLWLEPLDPGGARLKIVPGGETRGESVRSALNALRADLGLVMVHDAARPLTDPNDILRVLEAAGAQGAAILAVRASDTLKREKDGGGRPVVGETVPRGGLWLAQTPQAARRGLLEEAFRLGDPSAATDEASMLEAAGVPVALVEGRGGNIKITSPEDLALAEALRAAGEAGRSPHGLLDAQSLRAGQGWDFHRFDPTRELWLGCVRVPGSPGLSGHSDADVLAHAVIDALLGAAGLGDIGGHFPDSGEEWRGASGRRLLSLCREKLGDGFAIVNLDLTVFGEKPRIAPHRAEIESELAGVLGIGPERVNLKGKTTEGMGFLGRGEGLAASAAALLAKLRG